jgi:macrolide transport system ATP-binding/permease protein
MNENSMNDASINQAAPRAAPLLSLANVTREFTLGGAKVLALKGVSLQIEAGEFVAIIGRSGSGKSTLMNLLGCLDRPSSGRYEVKGQNTASLSSEALAQLRRERFGFIFQRYNLLPHLTAVGNVELPAMYAGLSERERRARAESLLTGLKLGARLDHRPNQLSGGEQQRVSIARSLVNRCDVILADEPTGALDRNTGAELMQVLVDLNRQGHTIIVVTHDPDIAAYANRTIEISDGHIIADRKHAMKVVASTEFVDVVDQEKAKINRQPKRAAGTNRWALFVESLKAATTSMKTHRLRTALTVLGITIGIAAVVSIVAIGAGVKSYMLEKMGSRFTNSIDIYAGRDWEERLKGEGKKLTVQDLQILSAASFVDRALPLSEHGQQLRFRNVDANVQVIASSVDYFQVRKLRLTKGIAFNEEHVRERAQVIVIDDDLRSKFFGDNIDPIGQTMLVGGVPCTVIGVFEDDQDRRFSAGEGSLLVPYSTGAVRLFGQAHFDRIEVRVRDGVTSEIAERGIEKILTLQHGEKDFRLSNRDAMVRDFENAMRGATLGLSLIAVISLVVGGIGVMNIMLVSVTERTREIGIRMAVGARQIDITQQFLVEAVCVCLVGGLAGVLVTLLVAQIFAIFVQDWKMIVTLSSIVAACLFSSAIGIIFGFVPARNAAKLDPVAALASD